MAESPQEWQVARPPSKSELFELYKNDLEGQLTALNGLRIDNSDLVERTRFELADIKQQLDKLKIEYPQDEEVDQLLAYHADLSRDLEEGRELRLDSSFDQIITEMQTEIQRSGVRVETPEQTIIPETVQKLKQIGINPSYIVTKGDKDAKTVVLFTQIHSNPDMEDAAEKLGAGKSQQQIYEAIMAAEKSGLTNLFFAEGFPGNVSISDLISRIPKDNPAYRALASQAEHRVKHELGEKIDVVGIENWNLLTEAFRSENLNYRATAHNILIGDNVADRLNGSEQSMAFMSLGMLHETIPGSETKHPLPISHILAYDNVNVVVVDAATPYFTPPEGASQEDIENFINRKK